MSKQLQFRLGTSLYEYTFRVGFLCFFLFFLSVFCLAGIWQLQRYHQKQDLVLAHQNALKASVTSWTGTTKLQPFQVITVNGQYVNELTLVLQNRIRQGISGYEVLTPFRIKGEKKLLLVNRGWIPRPDLSLDIHHAKTKQTIKGSVKFIDEHQFILGKNILHESTTPYLIQKIDFADIRRVTHEDYYPYVLRLDPTQQHGFVREWVVTAVMPERHLAYAVQWFAMAFVLVIAYLCFSCTRVKNDDAK